MTCRATLSRGQLPANEAMPAMAVWLWLLYRHTHEAWVVTLRAESPEADLLVLPSTNPGRPPAGAVGWLAWSADHDGFEVQSGVRLMVA